MSKPTILVVDDDIMLLEFIRVNLEAAGFQVVTAPDGRGALLAFEQQQPDLVILDVMMPGLDGLEVTRRLRRISIAPIIILTAVDEERDKVEAFELGADDYLTKPFSVPELLARARAVLRRCSWRERPPSSATLRFGAIEIDPEARTVLRAGQKVLLTPTEYNLLLELASHPGRVLTHRMLLQRVWGPEYGDEAEYLRVYISRLRYKLEENPTAPRYLLTEPGVGYRFEPRASTSSSSAA